MYKRTYFTKDNIIQYQSEYNFGNLSSIDLFYGGGVNDYKFSRYIFHFDEQDLKNKYNDCRLGDLSETKHILKFKHSGFTPNAYQCMPSSYQICLFALTQPWIEGCGVSENCSSLCTSFANLGCTVQKAPSNWYFAQSGTTWTQEGIYDSIYETPQYLMCKQIECSSPDIEFDISDIVNDMILNDTPNYGFGLAFHYDLEREISDTEKHVVFFSKETNTFYEPYLETEYVNPIQDDRTDFYLDKANKLYLHVNIDGEPTKLDSLPIVEIYDHLNVLQATYSGTCNDLGVYEVAFEVDSGSVAKCMAWTDKWTGLSINGKAMPDYSMKFNLKPAEDYYGFGYSTPKPQVNFAYSFRGIKREEVLQRGDVRKIYVDIKSPSNPHQQIAVDNVYYKIYLREGPYDELTIIDWTPVNRGVCENWFFLDTSWMIPQTYIIDFKVVSKQTVKTYPDKIKFNVIERPLFF